MTNSTPAPAAGPQIEITDEIRRIASENYWHELAAPYEGLHNALAVVAPFIAAQALRWAADYVDCGCDFFFQCGRLPCVRAEAEQLREVADAMVKEGR